jgi:hypothetical protein
MRILLVEIVVQDIMIAYQHFCTLKIKDAQASAIAIVGLEITPMQHSSKDEVSTSHKNYYHKSPRQVSIQQSLAQSLQSYCTAKAYTEQQRLYLIAQEAKIPKGGMYTLTELLATDISTAWYQFESIHSYED